MKKLIVFILMSVMCLAMLTGCGGGSKLSESLPGEWFVFHWYYNVNDGDNGFFDEPVFITFGEDGSVVATTEESTFEAFEGTYTVTGNSTIDITYSDGSFDSFQLKAAKHDGVDQIQLINSNTKYTLTLEPMSSWED